MAWKASWSASQFAYKCIKTYHTALTCSSPCLRVLTGGLMCPFTERRTCRPMSRSPCARRVLASSRLACLRYGQTAFGSGLLLWLTHALNRQLLGALGRVFPEAAAAARGSGERLDPQLGPASKPEFGDFQGNGALALASSTSPCGPRCWPRLRLQTDSPRQCKGAPCPSTHPPLKAHHIKEPAPFRLN